MEDFAYRTPEAGLTRRDMAPWGAIWSGVFAFAAIWAAFGTLGAAIFSTSAGTGNGFGWGMGVWSILLTMIAMYVAGRVTGHFSTLQSRTHGALIGTTMFGLSAVATLVLVLLTGVASTTTAMTVHSTPSLLGVLSSVGWFGWLACFLGWLCAMGGTVSATGPALRQSATVHDIRSDLRSAA